MPGIALLAVAYLGPATWAAIDPRSFFDDVGPFGAYNVHYIGDGAAFMGGVGLALAAALLWPPLRAGALVAAPAMTGLHAFNHWLDVSAANGDSNADVFAAVSLSAQFAFSLLLVRVVQRRPLA